MRCKFKIASYKKGLRKARAAIIMALIGLSNAMAIATLYIPQVMETSTPKNVTEHQDWLPISSVLFGYCIGNAITAFNAVPFISSSIRNHFGLMAMALWLMAIAPTMLTFAAACFLTGVGASVAQRLLGIAVNHAGPDRAASAVAGCVATALLAVLGLRVWGEQLASTLGWRTVFVLMSVPFVGWFFAGRWASINAKSTLMQDSPINAIRLIRSCIILRQSMVQQAMVFATYNAGWVLLTAQVAADQRAPASFWGSLAGIGSMVAVSILLDRGRILFLHRIGNAMMLLAGCPLLLLAYSDITNAGGQPSLGVLIAFSLGMAFIDAGMQLTLVANQTRVQAIAPASKGRLASLLTVSGALGGAIAGGTSRWLWQHYGWRAALTLVAFTAASGLLVACLPTSTCEHILGHRYQRRRLSPVGIMSCIRPIFSAVRWKADRDLRGNLVEQGSKP